MPSSIPAGPAPLLDGLLLLGRLLLASIFVHEGLVLAVNPDGAFATMAKLGVPAPLAAATILLQLGAGLAVAAGWQTRAAASSLCLFCIATAVLFHANFTARNEVLHFEKDLAIAGGMLTLAVCGAGRFALSAGLRRCVGRAPNGREGTAIGAIVADRSPRLSDP